MCVGQAKGSFACWLLLLLVGCFASWLHSRIRILDSFVCLLVLLAMVGERKREMSKCGEGWRCWRAVGKVLLGRMVGVSRDISLECQGGWWAKKISERNSHSLGGIDFWNLFVKTTCGSFIGMAYPRGFMSLCLKFQFKTECPPLTSPLERILWSVLLFFNKNAAR
jgi:hypothetical protein